MVSVVDRLPVARLVLEPAELAAVQAALPTPLRRPVPPPTEIDEAVLEGLRARRVLDQRGQLHPSVLAAFVLLADPAAPRFSVVAGSPAMARRTTLALSGALLAGLTVEEPSGRAEQLLASSSALGGALERLLPTLRLADRPGRRALRGADPGRLLAAVEAMHSTGPLPTMLVEQAELGAGLAAAEALAGGLAGSLQVTLSLPAGAVADGPVLDRMLWVAADKGWWSLRPGADRTGRPRLDVVPVQPSELGRDLAPLVAAAALALGAQDD